MVQEKSVFNTLDKKDDVSINVKSNVLTIKGERFFNKETTEKKEVLVNSRGLSL